MNKKTTKKKDWGDELTDGLNRSVTNSGGIDSLLNEAKLRFRRGQTITFRNSLGQIQKGKYVMASSAEGCIVLNMGGRHGIPRVIAISSIIKPKP